MGVDMEEWKEIYPWLDRFHQKDKGWGWRASEQPAKPEAAKTQDGESKATKRHRSLPDWMRDAYPWVDKVWSEDEGWILNKPPHDEDFRDNLGVLESGMAARLISLREKDREKLKAKEALKNDKSGISSPQPIKEEDADEKTYEISPTASEHDEGKDGTQVHAVRTISRVENPNYYEKDGLRTYGDGQDHDTEPKMTFRRFMVFLAMSFLWTGSQIPTYLFGGIIPIIVSQIGGEDRYVWVLLGHQIPVAAVTPFVGALADLFGRKNVAVFGGMCIVVGNAVLATANDMNVFVGGMALAGIGAGICELVALAVTAEQAPTSKRGLYVGAMIITILPFCPSVVYAYEIATTSSYRWIGLWCGLWALMGVILTIAFYWPPPRPNSSGLSKWEKVLRMDITGGVLSTGALISFLGGISWAGGQYPWSSTHVIAPIVIGLLAAIAFILWECFFVRYPMFPRRLKRNPRVLTVLLIITCVSGANFFAVLVFWPNMFFYLYAGSTPFSKGVGSLPVGFGIIAGSVIVSVLITIFRGKIRLLMVASCIVMTAGNGAMASATLTNLSILYLPVCLACIGVGAVIIPNQIIATIICPDDLIATITAATISIRVIGGSIGFCVYYNILKERFTHYAYVYILPAAAEAGVDTPGEVVQIAKLLAANQPEMVMGLPFINTTQKLDSLIYAAREAFAQSYPQVYYASIGFGAITIIAACFLPDITQYMDNHVAVEYK